MMMHLTLRTRKARPLVALIAFQTMTALFFIIDSAGDLMADSMMPWHAIPEAAMTIGLVIGIVFEVRVLRRLLREKARMQQGLDAASGALAVLIAGYFRDWGLTQAESDVALFTIKGFSIAEIAALRGSAGGTIKTHMNAIYRKAGVPGRAQLVSLLIEDLMGGVLAPQVGNRQDVADGSARADMLAQPLARRENLPIVQR